MSVSTNLFEAQPADDEARGFGDQAESTGLRARRLRPRRIEVAPERAPPREATELPHQVPPPHLRPAPHGNGCSTTPCFGRRIRDRGLSTQSSTDYLSQTRGDVPITVQMGLCALLTVEKMGKVKGRTLKWIRHLLDEK